MLTVGVDAIGVEKLLREGGLSCPDCASAIGPWGFARPRWLRCVDGVVRLRPRRSRCSGCGATHVLLPPLALLRRADAAAVIGTALTLKAAGLGHRCIAARLGRPTATVRGWLRRFAERAGVLRRWFTTIAVAVHADIPPIEPVGVFADAVASIGVAVAAMARRWPMLLTVSAWEIASAVTHGRLLSADAPPQWINTSRLWAD